MATKKTETPAAAEAAPAKPKEIPAEDLLSMVKVAEDFTDQDRMKVGLYGTNGSGKTTAIARALAPLCLLTEMQGVPAIKAQNKQAGIAPVLTTGDVAKARKLVRLPQILAKYDTVGFDGLTDGQRLLKAFYTGQQKGGGVSPHKDTWGVIIEATSRLVRELRDLPMHVIVTMLDQETYVDGVGLVSRPHLQGKTLPKEIGQYFNMVGYLRKRETDSGRVRHEVVFEGGERYTSKKMPPIGDNPGLDDVEPPEPQVWAHKLFGTPISDEVRARWEEWRLMEPSDGNASLPGDESKKDGEAEATAAPIENDPMA